MPNLIVRLLNNEKISAKELYTILTALERDFQTQARHPLIKTAIAFDDTEQTVTLYSENTATLFKVAKAFGSGSLGVTANAHIAAQLYSLLLIAPVPAKDKTNYIDAALTALDKLYTNPLAQKQNSDNVNIPNAIKARQTAILHANIKITEAKTKADAIRATAEKTKADRIAATAEIQRIFAIQEDAARRAKAKVITDRLAADVEASRLAAEQAKEKEAETARLAAEAKKPENIVNKFLSGMIAATSKAASLGVAKTAQANYFTKGLTNIDEASKAYLHTYMQKIHNGEIEDERFDYARTIRNPFISCFGRQQGNTRTWATMFNATQPAAPKAKPETAPESPRYKTGM